MTPAGANGRVTARLVAVASSCGAFWGGWKALLPAVPEQVGASINELGQALFAIPLGALPAVLPTGRFVDIYGGRILFAASTAFAMAVLLPGLAQSLRGRAPRRRLIRAVLLSASMKLLGDWNWYPPTLPAWRPT